MNAPQSPPEAATGPPGTDPDSGPAPDDFKPQAPDLVVTDPDDANEVFRVLDRHDESQILDALQERVLDESLYDFGEGRNRKVDLSFSGVRECIHLMNRTGKVKLRIIPKSLEVEEFSEEDEAYYRATVWAEDRVTGEAYSGTSVEPKVLKLRNGKERWDEFAHTKAVNKAERNALKKFIPEPIRQTLIAQYMKEPERVKKIAAGAGAEAIAELPPPATSEKAEQLRGECRRIYDEIKQIDRTKWLLPGAFNALLVRHEWSEDRLGELVEHLAGILEKAQAEAAA